MEKIRTHKELKVYNLSFEAGMEVFEFIKKFPPEERFSLTDQVRRSSRAVSGIIAETWRKRRYPKSFVAKLNDAEAEVAETQVWLDYALTCNYINLAEYKPLYENTNISLPC